MHQVGMQVPAGTVVYLPRPRIEDGSLSEPSDWDSDAEELDAEPIPEPEAEDEEQSSEAIQKRSLGEEIADLANDGQQFVLARGGIGGRGNAKHSVLDRRSDDSLIQPKLHRPSNVKKSTASISSLKASSLII